MALQESATLGQKAHETQQLAQRVYEEATRLGQALFGPRPEDTGKPTRATQSVDDDVDEATSILRQTVSVLSSLNQNVAIGANRQPSSYQDDQVLTMPPAVATGSRW